MPHDRRRFLEHLFGGVAATALLPSLVEPHKSPCAHLGRALAPFPDSASADERFWQLVKGQFPLRSDLILMNAANLCPSPFPVIDVVSTLTRDVDRDASFQNRSKFGQLREQARDGLARYLGADADEIVITRNTSEGNNTVINGLTLGRGDEVVIWEQNHPTNNVAWDVRAARYGYTVKRVKTPPSPQTGEELIQAFGEAITPKAKVVAFSHVSNVSGVGLPAKQLCRMARELGILTLVDGAQTFGALRVDLHDMGCDFYTGSAHKWFVGPKEAGVLFVRRDRVADLWPSGVGVGWANALENGARKFETLGQRDDAAVSAVGTAVQFHNTIGARRVEARVRELAAALKKTLRDRLPDVRFHTPWAPEFSAGVVVFSPPRTDAREMFGALYREHNIACAARGGDFTGIRLCPHIYNTMEEIEHVVDVIAELV